VRCCVWIILRSCRYVRLQHRVARWWMNWKGLERRRSWRNQGTFTAFVLEGLTKITKTLKVTGVPNEILTEPLPNTSRSWQCGFSANLLSLLTFWYRPTCYAMKHKVNIVSRFQIRLCSVAFLFVFIYVLCSQCYAPSFGLQRQFNRSVVRIRSRMKLDFSISQSHNVWLICLGIIYTRTQSKKTVGFELVSQVWYYEKLQQTSSRRAVTWWKMMGRRRGILLHLPLQETGRQSGAVK
jgi:hypothetical protein